MNAPAIVQDLVVSNLGARAGRTAIVRDVSFRLAQGLPLTLLGASGSGKSLIAHAIMGSLPKGLEANGTIHLAGVDLNGQRPEQRRANWGRTIALLPQEPWLALDPTMRIGGQVGEIYRYVRGMPCREAGERARAELTSVGLDGQSSAYPFQLSGGMCQRAAIAMVHAADAPLVIADEPTKGLDAHLRDGVVERLRQEVDGGRLLLTITHDVSVARGIGGLVGIMCDGEIVELGPADHVLDVPGHPYSKAFLAADPGKWASRQERAIGDMVLSGTGLSKRFGARVLFEDLDLSIHRGEVAAIVGPSGCGKTTLGNVILGLVRQDAGSLRRQRGISDLRFQKLYQDPPAAFAPRQILRQGLTDLLKRHDLEWSAAENLLQRLDLPRELLERYPNEVSGGELQRIAILRALLLDPVFLFADEATSRLDPISQKQVIEIMIDCVRDRAMGLLIVTHDLTLAQRIASKLVLLGDKSSIEPSG